jgi:uncharacterized membrane protein (DUF106 family)
MVQKQMNLGSVIAWFLQILYNIVQFSLPDILSTFQNHPTLMLVVIIAVNGFFSIIQVYFHIDPKEIETIIQGIKNLAKDNSLKELSETDLTAIETEGMYWIKKLISYLTQIRLKKEAKNES